MISGSVSGRGSPGRSNVELMSGSPSSSSRALRDRVIGHANADRAPLRVLKALRRLVRRPQDERVRSRRVCAKQPILPVVDARIGCDVR